MENQQITHEDLLWEALQPIEMALKKSYITWRSTNLKHTSKQQTLNVLSIWHGRLYQVTYQMKNWNGLSLYLYLYLYGHGNGQYWVNGQITGVHTYPWPTCGSQTVHTRYTIVSLIRLDIWSPLLGYIYWAWPEVDLFLYIWFWISLLIIEHVASIPV